jgi:hypothetical protein
MSFVSSSELWGDEAGARLCQVIMESNDGRAQQVIENKTDLLDLMTKEDLEQVDDLGLTLPYLAVHYDRPEILKYLKKRGFDLSLPCDAMNYGNAMFYAVNLSRLNIVTVLDSLGCYVNAPCEFMFKMNPLMFADRIGDVLLKNQILEIISKERHAAELFLKNFLKAKQQNKYLKIKKCVILIQKIFRKHVFNKRNKN